MISDFFSKLHLYPCLKENNINMVLSLSVMDLSVLRRFSTKKYTGESVFLSKLCSDELAER